MKNSTITITYKRTALSKGIELDIEGTWTEEGFDDIQILHAGADLRDALNLDADEEAILAQANAKFSLWLDDKAVDQRIDEARLVS